ncbi:MAG: hypothetical protein HFE84_12480 [Lachnospiraceae bacterium]|nr:hypothetical protein [Lachnospiraceae bacterium]
MLKKIMPEILIVYEHKAREYQCLTLLKTELNKRGYTVRICHYNFGGRWFYHFFANPRLVIGPGAHYHEVLLGSGMNFVDWMTDSIRGRSPFFLNLQMEQVFRDGKASAWNVMHTSDYLDRVYYACWGSRRYEQLEKLGIPENKRCISGAIQMDFLGEHLAGFYKSKEEIAKQYNISEEKKWLLFISGFLWASKTSNVMIYEASQQRKAGIEITNEEMLKDWRASIDSQKIVLQWIDTYLDEEDDIFIYRPHPGEKITDCVKRVQKKHPDKFKVIEYESVQQWIKVCDVINLWTSTAIVEVYAAKKICNIVQPILLSNRMLPILFDHASHIIDTYDEFSLAQHSYIEKKNSFPINEAIIKDYYFLDTKPAYKKTCDFIEDILKRPVACTSKSKFTWRIILNKTYLQWRYAGFYLMTHIKLSAVFPFKRRGLKNTEMSFENSHLKSDIKFSREEKQILRKIKRLVKNI